MSFKTAQFFKGYHFLFLTYFNGSNATFISLTFSLFPVGCLSNLTFRCISESSLLKSRGNLTRILGVGYFIRTVEPSGLTKVVGYRRVNKLRLTLVTTARLELKSRFCSKQIFDKLKREKFRICSLMIFSALGCRLHYDVFFIITCFGKAICSGVPTIGSSFSFSHYFSEENFSSGKKLKGVVENFCK